MNLGKLQKQYLIAQVVEVYGDASIVVAVVHLRNRTFAETVVGYTCAHL